MIGYYFIVNSFILYHDKVKSDKAISGKFDIKIEMTKWISFKAPLQEVFEGRKVMADPGIHPAMEDVISKRIFPGERVLEVGAGAGAFTLRLRKLGYKVEATDIDGDKFDISGIPFRRISLGDKLSSVFGKSRYKAVVAVEVLEHIRNPWEFFKETWELLLPDGLLFLTTPNITSFYSRIVFLREGRFLHFRDENSWKMGHINPIPFFEIEQIAKNMRFTLLLRQPIGHMPVIDLSVISLRRVIMIIPRLVFYLYVKGQKDGNVLLYCFRKTQ